jgi:hypothetical protein
MFITGRIQKHGSVLTPLINYGEILTYPVNLYELKSSGAGSSAN